MTVEECAGQLLKSFEVVCDCETVTPYSVFGKIFIAVEMLSRTFDIQGFKESIKVHTKWLLHDRPDVIPFDRFLRFSDIIFIPKCKFNSLFDSLIDKVIEKVFSQKCSHLVAKEIFHNRALSVVALFVCRYKLLLHMHRTGSMMRKFSLHVEESCDELKLMGTKYAVKYLKDIRNIHQSRDIMNRFTGKNERIDILDYRSDHLELILFGLMNHWRELREAKNAPTRRVKRYNSELFCHPVYRQIFILMDFQKNW
jgi:hypothetical protein